VRPLASGTNSSERLQQTLCCQVASLACMRNESASCLDRLEEVYAYLVTAGEDTRVFGRLDAIAPAAAWIRRASVATGRTGSRWSGLLQRFSEETVVVRPTHGTEAVLATTERTTSSLPMPPLDTLHGPDGRSPHGSGSPRGLALTPMPPTIQCPIGLFREPSRLPTRWQARATGSTPRIQADAPLVCRDPASHDAMLGVGRPVPRRERLQELSRLAQC
jgi:hypothetical protein